MPRSVTRKHKKVLDMATVVATDQKDIQVFMDIDTPAFIERMSALDPTIDFIAQQNHCSTTGIKETILPVYIIAASGGSAIITARNPGNWVKHDGRILISSKETIAASEAAVAETSRAKNNNNALFPCFALFNIDKNASLKNIKFDNVRATRVCNTVNELLDAVAFEMLKFATDKLSKANCKPITATAPSAFAATGFPAYGAAAALNSTVKDTKNPEGRHVAALLSEQNKGRGIGGAGRGTPS
jgi:hypothetical protein